MKLFGEHVVGKRFAKLLAGEHDACLAAVNAVTEEVATKNGLKKLRGAQKESLEVKLDGLLLVSKRF